MREFSTMSNEESRIAHRTTKRCSSVTKLEVCFTFMSFFLVWYCCYGRFRSWATKITILFYWNVERREKLSSLWSWWNSGNGNWYNEHHVGAALLCQEMREYFLNSNIWNNKDHCNCPSRYRSSYLKFLFSTLTYEIARISPITHLAMDPPTWNSLIWQQQAVPSVHHDDRAISVSFTVCMVHRPYNLE